MIFLSEEIAIKEKQQQDDKINDLKNDIEKLLQENETIKAKTTKSCPLLKSCNGKGNNKKGLNNHFIINNCPIILRC